MTEAPYGDWFDAELDENGGLKSPDIWSGQWDQSRPHQGVQHRFEDGKHQWRVVYEETFNEDWHDGVLMGDGSVHFFNVPIYTTACDLEQRTVDGVMQMRAVRREMQAA